MDEFSGSERFRNAALAEDGACVSVGARLSYVRAAVPDGKVMLLDLSNIPDSVRPGLIGNIEELVKKAGGELLKNLP
jgi:hypothetical protein